MQSNTDTMNTIMNISRSTSTITMMRSVNAAVAVGIITTTTAMPAAVTPMPGAARMTPLIP